MYEGAGRDVRGIYDAFIKGETATAPAADWLDRLATAQRGLSQRALANAGIEPLVRPHKQVGAAAKECGMDGHSA